MKQLRNVEDYNFAYSVLRYIVDLYVKCSYRKFKIYGRENIPKDGAVIYAPNHCNSLMDPLVVLTIGHERKVFVARADIFRKPAIRKILTFLKIMPINRKRDGIRSVRNTADTIKKSIRVLNNQVKFCILPEGTHRAKHSLLPIGKGIARISYGANEEMGKEKPIYIVPVGLEYGDYFRFRSTVLVQIAKPINITEYIGANMEQGEHNIMEGIRELVKNALKEKIVYVEDNEDYDAVWELSKLKTGSICKYSLLKRFKANKQYIAQIEQFKAEVPQKASVLFEKVNHFIEERKKAQIGTNSIVKHNALLNSILSTFMLILVLPVFAIMTAVSWPVILSNEVAVSKVKDRAFHNSFRCGITLVLWTLMFIVYVIILFCTLRWYYALGASILLWPAPMLVYDYFEIVRNCASSWRWLFNRKLKALYHELLNLLNIYKYE